MSSKDMGPNPGHLLVTSNIVTAFICTVVTSTLLKQSPAVPLCPHAPMECLLKSRNHLCWWFQAFRTQPVLCRHCSLHFPNDGGRVKDLNFSVKDNVFLLFNKNTEIMAQHPIN